MRLQQSDYVGAEKIQQELVRRLPGDPVMQEFSKYLPTEAKAQKDAANEYGDEYYDEEEQKKEEAEEEAAYGKEEDEEEEVPADTTTQVPVEGGQEGAVKTVEEEKKGGEGEHSEYEDEDEGYGEEDYDEEGKYKWGKEGEDFEWYYREDKEAYERGDLMPNTLNPPVMLDKATIERAVASKQRAETGASKENGSGSINAGGPVYRTNNRKGVKPTQNVETGEWKY